MHTNITNATCFNILLKTKIVNKTHLTNSADFIITIRISPNFRSTKNNNHIQNLIFIRLFAINFTFSWIVQNVCWNLALVELFRFWKPFQNIRHNNISSIVHRHGHEKRIKIMFVEKIMKYKIKNDFIKNNYDNNKSVYIYYNQTKIFWS